MLSSGETAVGTSGDAPVTLFTLSPTYGRITVINTGTAPGLLSLNGTTWIYIPGGPSSRTFTDFVVEGTTLQIKRIPGGADMTGVWADAY